MPKIQVKHGDELGVNKRIFGGYNVIVPKTGKPNKLRKEISKALIISSLDLIKKQQPKRFDRFENRFKKSFQTTQDALVDYLKNTGDRKKMVGRGKKNTLKRFPPDLYGFSF